MSFKFSEESKTAVVIKKEETFSFEEIINLAAKDKMTYANAAERLLDAIGEPELVDTSSDPALSRIFSNQIIKRYPTFAEFFGMEDSINEIVNFIKHAAQGLEEKKQVLYLLGPVGSAKSSLAERIKALMQKNPVYAIVGSPVNDHWLALVKLVEELDPDLAEKIYAAANIPKSVSKGRYQIPSPWLTKRFYEGINDGKSVIDVISGFEVRKFYPSILRQEGIAKTEPGDENNQDISSLVGKVDIRKLEAYAQNDPDAYSYSGSLCKGNQGLMEFVEMFKAPIKVLHPLLTATQEGNFNPTEGFAAIPFDGIILAHSNESEWSSFRSNKNNEAFLDRVYIVKVKYNLRVSEEVKIYQKLIENSELAGSSVAPKTYEYMAELAMLTRLKEPENSSIYSKMRVYDGENLKDIDPKAKSYQEYRDMAGPDEGMEGLSTRFAFKVLSKVFNFDATEVAANPVHLFHVIQSVVDKGDMDPALQDNVEEALAGYIIPRYIEYIGNEIQTCYLESYGEYGQNIFDNYVTYADFWIQDQEYRDPETGAMFDREALNAELEKIEKPAGIANPKDFRNEVVNFVLRARASHDSENPSWLSYEKMRSVIEKKMFSNTEDLLPVISFNAKGSQEDRRKHADFVSRMVAYGYTEKQVRLLSEWYIRVRKSQ